MGNGHPPHLGHLQLRRQQSRLEAGVGVGLSGPGVYRESVSQSLRNLSMQEFGGLRWVRMGAH